MSAGLVPGEAHRVDQELLHVDGVRVEGERAAHGEPDDEGQLPGVAQQLAHGPVLRLLRRLGLEGLRLHHVAAHVEAEDGERGATQEGDAPAPRLELRAGEHQPLQHQQRQRGEQLAHDEGDVLEGAVEAAVAGGGHLAEVGGAGAVLAAEREPLEQPGEDQHDGRQHADLRIRRAEGDDEGAQAHERDGQRQGGTAPAQVRVEPHHPAAHRADEEAEREDSGRVELLHHGVAVGEERLREVQREGRVDVEVVPLDEVAHRAAEDGEQALAHARSRRGTRTRRTGTRGWTRFTGSAPCSPE